MSELFKSKLGWVLAGIHFLMVLTCLFYLVLINDKNVIVTFILLILTAPWGFLLMILPVQLGIVTFDPASHQHDDLIFNVAYTLGGLINAFILYLLGFLLTKAFNYLFRKNQGLN